MNRTPNISAVAPAHALHFPVDDLPALHIEKEHRPMVAALRRRAERQLRKERKQPLPAPTVRPPEADQRRAQHELQVHQIELEMQNRELQESRDRMEELVEKFTDLYDFAPVGYFSVDERGEIMEANLTGSKLLGIERSRLVNRRLPRFMAPGSHPVFAAFLKKVFAEPGRHICEASLLKADGTAFWADLQAVPAPSLPGAQKWCRLAVSDITPLKRADEAQQRLEALVVTNLKLEREIARRQIVEKALKSSEQQHGRMLKESRQMQERLRQLSRQILRAQEEERKAISRELHDVIAQTLTGINVRLANLQKEAAVNLKGLDRNIARTQKLVEKSVEVIHRFARELRPAVLDDLGLIPALHTFLKSFAARTGVRARLTAFAGLEQLDPVRRTVLYRVAQEALTNVSRHAQASQVEVSIQKLPGCICLKIIDDGKSFRLESTPRGNRLGLLGMRERVEMVGGTFSVEPVPGQGTTVKAQIPFRKVHGK